MSTAPQKLPLTAAEYLAGELVAQQKHEYVAGTAYAMSGASVRHNRIATNVTGTLYSQLRGQPCQVFNSDMKIRIRSDRPLRFYYPDASVVCHPNPDTDLFQDRPVLVVEVLSQSTRRVDELEKHAVYLGIPSLRGYLLLEQDRPVAVLYRHGPDGFIREDYAGEEAKIDLPEINCQLRLAEAYANVTFPTTPGEYPTTGEESADYGSDDDETPAST